MSHHSCAGCKADLKWSPGEGALVCPHCGAVNRVHGDVMATVDEQDLDTALNARTQGWGGVVAEFRCTQCGAVSAVEPHVTETACAFCGTSQLEVQPVKDDHIRPESLLPFAIDKMRARSDFSRWAGTLHFRPSDLKRMSKLETLRGVYIPAFSFDLKTQTRWQAKAGYHYTVDVSDGKGGSKQERRTRWESVSGVFERAYDDWLVSGSNGVSQALFQGLLPFDTSRLVSYDNRYLARFIAERSQRSIQQSWEMALEGIEAEVLRLLRSEIPGDTHKDLSHQIRHWDRRFKHFLLPIWIAAYRYKGETFHYVVNGVTGKMHGTAPWSWFKIIGAVLVVLAAVAGVVVAMGGK